jgi:hypothetical protein
MLQLLWNTGILLIVYYSVNCGSDAGNSLIDNQALSLAGLCHPVQTSRSAKVCLMKIALTKYVEPGYGNVRGCFRMGIILQLY